MRAPPREGEAPHPTVYVNHTRSSEPFPVHSNPDDILIVSASLEEFSEDALTQATMVQMSINLARASKAASLVHISFNMNSVAGAARIQHNLDELVAPYW
jgi:hypothetical protein